MSFTRRQVIVAASAGAAVATFPAPNVLGQARKELVLGSLGGTFAANSKKVFWEPFTAETGIKIIEANYTLAKHKAMVESGQVEWDIGLPAIAQLGELLDINAIVPIDYSKVKKSQYSGVAAGEYHVGFQYYSSNIALNTNSFPAGKPAPKGWADYYDLEVFPGPRSMQRQPYVALESALLADGVSPDKLYPLDVDRAFKKLDQIKSSVSVWWTTGAQAVDVLASGECTMGVAWDSRIAPAKAARQPVDNVFAGGLLVPSIYTVIKGAPNLDNAFAFLDFMGRADRQAEMAKINYSAPSNLDAIALIDPAIAKGLCTHPDNLKQLIPLDALGYWRKNLAPINERFTAWLSA